MREGAFRRLASKAVKVRNFLQVLALINDSEWGVSGPVHRPRTIETIPDDLLLEIFGFYVEAAYWFYIPNEFHGIEYLEAWFTLVHVCRRWRSLVFASPRRLKLRLVCTRGRPVREMLDIWPTLPIVVDDEDISCYQRPRMEHFDSVTAALEHRNRVCQISLENLPSSLFPNFMEMMQESFLELTHLYLGAEIESPMLHPDSFLGGSAPPHDRSHWNAFHSRNYRSYLCLPRTLLNFAFATFPILDIFHPGQWSLACRL
jgi:hypothetical protein